MHIVGPEGDSVCVVGAGTRFLSGISYYTVHLANALARSHSVSAILMRQMLPTRLYPGRERVGADLTQIRCDSRVSVFNGVDWFWLPSMLGALVFLWRQHPKFIIFQWWSATVLHSYLLLAVAARLMGARLIIEFHESQDTGEASLSLARAYARVVLPLLVRLASRYVVHSQVDREQFSATFHIPAHRFRVIHLGPFDQYQGCGTGTRTAEPERCHLLFFGTIRRYKGLEDLIEAFDSIPDGESSRYRLTIVGETWEGWTVPSAMIRRSRGRDRITFVNRYVSDSEAADFLAAADAVVLPYHRSGASGPLHVAMSWGLPVIVTSVGGLPEAVAGYAGAIVVPPRQPQSLRAAIEQVAGLQGKRFADPHSWSETVSRYDELFEQLGDQAEPRANLSPGRTDR